jgi:diguanylate cyclase (GGDEF)-like protein/PAS domain S-box-containing protein
MYLIFLSVTALASAVFAASGFRHRQRAGFGYFAALEAAAVWWILCYLGEQLDPPRARLWFALKFPAIAAIPPSWFLFVRAQVGRPITGRDAWPFYVWPLVVGPLVLTNDLHRTFFSEIVQRRELAGLNGPLFFVHLAFSYGLFLGGAVLLAREAVRRQGLDRWRSLLLLAGGLLPFGGNVLNETAKRLPAVAGLVEVNPTLPAFALSAVFFGWVSQRYGLLDPRPLARELLFESMTDLVVVLDDQGVIVDANRATVELLGASRSLTGTSWDRAFAGAPGWQRLPLSGNSSALERPLQTPAGTLWFDIQHHPLVDRTGRVVGGLVSARDVTSRKQLEDELRRLSFRDGLTGLSNRNYFDREGERLRRSREFPVTVFAFDLDGLKATNDTHGHHAGDRLIQDMARFLQQFFRAGDRICRTGGDEFLVLLPRTTTAEAETIALRLRHVLEGFNMGRDLRLEFSLGHATIDQPEGWDAAVRLADSRLYDDKQARAQRSDRTVPLD